MKTKTISKDHMLQALSQYLWALSAIEDNESVKSFKRVSDGYELTIKEVE